MTSEDVSALMSSLEEISAINASILCVLYVMAGFFLGAAVVFFLFRKF